MEVNARMNKHPQESENHCLWCSVTTGVGAAAARQMEPPLHSGWFFWSAKPVLNTVQENRKKAHINKPFLTGTTG